MPIMFVTGLSPTAPPPCVDVQTDCNLYETGFCQNYKPWARDNCRKTCNLCGRLTKKYEKFGYPKKFCNTSGVTTYVMAGISEPFDHPPCLNYKVTFFHS